MIAGLLCSVLLLQGCLAFAASQLGYMEAKSKYSKLYDVYKSDLEMRNSKDAENGLDPQPILGFKDWLIEQPLRHNEIKVFKNNGVISDEDARLIKERQAMENEEINKENEK
jgi:hypothetical protein